MANRGRPRKIVVTRSSGKRVPQASAGVSERKGSLGSGLNLMSDVGLVVLSTDSQGVLGVQSSPKRWAEEEEVLIDNEVGVDPLLDPPYLRALTGAEELGKLDDDGLVENVLAGNRDVSKGYQLSGRDRRNEEISMRQYLQRGNCCGKRSLEFSVDWLCSWRSGPICGYG
ncbi:hypothetical protein Dimus_009116 [Dionaea muscipula]